jgi:lipoprotein-anchoring transpeptidase ErfK/SrfK
MRLACVAACFGLILSASSPAFAMDPQVIPGYSPDGDPTVSYAQPLRPLPRPHSNLGGGLLEALVGSDHGDAAPPSSGYVASAQPTYDYGAAAGAYGSAVYAVQPGKIMDPAYQRQEVAYDGRESAGTIVVDTQNKFLFLVEGEGRAMRYGIGVGRPGFLWHGTKVITRKAEWPDWTPPSEMLLRRPDLPTHMEGGIANPLGARAMYLGSTLYRIHGTNEPETIGTNVSSGCIRLTNEDVSDLYSRVKVGTRVVVM